ncbi:PTS glucitol/sorbitol transporter subunit IIA [Streptococcus parauberis]|uniref:PTS glucitol/sorbitol transporter subunit IIA n=1 Tax=Streptococcus parauberis TaxID=1348 RepID=A0AAE4HUP9_9STRE|nr:PTS glucitol/sorbitol transporter subunit IIA [Streptococcus parauberis]AEF26167.1 glucitol/sorbitol-specific phosphotransferase system (PTS), IIA component [Streptococcus parauberis KCTC 11537]EMF48646.1 PTS system, glucitol/sorbitol-specific IIA component [Streptococcus parauberis KRS-02109]KYP18076.1 PTS system glucitol/sorbitol-specific transporter subunit IIA [Streptococcus parauberis]KYP19053.1 PTS system glucitol/sorbitol-specific transporter subunit IIA [Streptococcus parauberis]KYP
MVKVFETKVLEIGSEAQNMIENTNMLILFGEGAPADLSEFCFTINNKELTGTIIKNGKVIIGEEKYTITAVGKVVEKNLSSLGHITLSFDGSEEASLPGTLHVKGVNSPHLEIGSIIQIDC